MREGGFVAPEKAAPGGAKEADAEHDDHDRGDGQGGAKAAGEHGVVGGGPGEADGYGVFRGAEGEVGDRLGAGGDDGAEGDFGAVGDGGEEAADSGGDELQAGREVGAGCVGEKRGGRDADDGVECVPDEVDAGDFVGDELPGEEDGAGGEDPRIAEGFESAGKGDPVITREETEGEDGGVEVEPGGEAHGDDERRYISCCYVDRAHGLRG